MLACALLAACGHSDGANHTGVGGRAAVAGGNAGALGSSGGDAAVQGGNAGSSGNSGGVGANGGTGGTDTAGVGGATVVTGGSAGSSAGGSGGTSGGIGSGGSEADAGAGGGPDVELQPVGTVPADKIDLLFVIDNSISMADKHEILKSAVPLLVRRLVTPVCVDAAGNPTGQLATPDGLCATGQPEFPPIRDFHIGVVTSSLGGHGGDTCPVSTSYENDDKAHLLPSVRAGLTSWNSSGFLAWDPEQRATPPGAKDAAALVTNFQNMVVAAGERGCGYESSLEAWYRFLIDPEPPSAVVANSTRTGVDITAPDTVTLSQRAAFLRPDSLVGIVVLSDENDCSIIDGGQGYLVGTQVLNGQTFRMPRATSACAKDPNDPCCTSCLVANVPSGCPALSQDAECQKGTSYQVTEDSLNLRCWEQKRRFGFDLLYPIQRYLNGLTQNLVANRSGTLVQNPLFQAPEGTRHRDPSRVFLLGILGLPWQDVADDASLTDNVRLRYLSAAELEQKGRFSMMLGDNGSRPSDGLMFETPLDRSKLGFGPHPLTGEALVPATSTNPKQNSMNGHESNIVDGSDLQYSCIFPLSTTRQCTEDMPACDCRPSEVPFGRALCQPPSGGATGTTQYFAKAYPGLRQLELIRQFGSITNNSIAASICPKLQTSGMPTTDPNYGYNPAMSALVERMKSALAPSCLSEPIIPDANGAIACHVLEVTSGTGACACTGAGRSAASANSAAAIRSRLAAALYCGGAGQPSCESLCVCEVAQLPTAQLAACQNDANVPADAAGFCYLDQARNLGAPSLLESCPVDRKRRLRFVGPDIPRPGSATYVFCPR
ncbi:MAG: hypothetical protein ACOY0T_03635 [Myxococcota bacterium]